MRQINKVYIGLPVELAKKVSWVLRDNRTNPLSHKPGGSDVIVEFHNEDVFGYDWVKFPSNYIDKIFENVFEREHNTILKKLKDFEKLEVIKKHINKIYARRYEDENDHSIVPFTEIWNSKSAKQLPKNMLLPYDANYNRDNSKNQTTQQSVDEYYANDEDIDELPF